MGKIPEWNLKVCRQIYHNMNLLQGDYNFFEAFEKGGASASLFSFPKNVFT